MSLPRRLSVLLIWSALLIPLVSTGQDSIRTTFKIVSLPTNTPQDASIYIAGDFAGWYPDVKGNKLQRDEEGILSITLTHTQEAFLYKFTRGTWGSVEGRANGRARSNREFTHNGSHQVIEIEIDSWEDISMRTYVLYMYGLFIIGAQGILLIFGLNSLGRSKNNTLLSLLLILVSCSLFGRASTFDPRIFNFQPKLILLPEIILFTYAPILYIYFARLAQVKVRPYLKILIFLPALAQLIIYIPYLFKANQTFVYLMIDRELFEAFAASGAFSLLFCSFFWWRIGRWKPKIKGLVKQNELTTAHLSFLNTIQLPGYLM